MLNRQNIVYFLFSGTIAPLGKTPPKFYFLVYMNSEQKYSFDYFVGHLYYKTRTHNRDLDKGWKVRSILQLAFWIRACLLKKKVWNACGLEKL